MSYCRVSLFLSLMFVVSGCNISVKGNSRGVQGSGVSKTEKRDVSGFERINVIGASKVNVTFGAKDSLSVSADDNLLELIDSSLDNGLLTIKPKESISPKSELVFDISVASLKSISIAGAVQLNLKDVEGDALDVEISGAGTATGHGQLKKLDVDILGAGSVDFEELIAESAKISFSGAGSGTVFASQAIDATINGAGSLNVLGSPAEVKKQVNGIGSIRIK